MCRVRHTKKIISTLHLLPRNLNTHLHLINKYRLCTYLHKTKYYLTMKKTKHWQSHLTSNVNRKHRMWIVVIVVVTVIVITTASRVNRQTYVTNCRLKLVLLL